MAKPIYIELHVRNQMIVGVHKLPRLIVEGSKQFVYLMIDFDEEWSDSSINVIFSHDSARRKTVSLAWHGEALEVPQELLVPGGLRISCVGHANDGEQRLTTHYMSDPIRIYRAGPLEGDEVQSAPAPLWEQTLAAVGSLGFLKTADRSSAVAAINEIFGLSIAKIEQDAVSDKENVITITLQNGETKKFVIRNGSDHAKLLNRDADDQHPISAVSGLRAELDDKQPKGSYLTEETDPTVPAWAKQPEKPAYTAAEVHALPDTYTPPVDATLTQSGQAADAKATGDALRSLSEDIDNVRNGAKWKLLRSIVVPDDPTSDQSGVTWIVNDSGGVTGIEFDTDESGSNFNCKELSVTARGICDADGRLDFYTGDILLCSFANQQVAKMRYSWIRVSRCGPIWQAIGSVAAALRFIYDTQPLYGSGFLGGAESIVDSVAALSLRGTQVYTPGYIFTIWGR